MGTREKKIISYILMIVMLLGCVGYSSVTSYATGDTGSEATDGTADDSTNNGTNDASNDTDNTTEQPSDASVSKAREDVQDAEKKLESAQEILDNLKSAKNNLENYVIQLDKSINELQVEITNLEMTQKKLEETIEDTKKNLAEAQSAQEEQYDQMKKRIQMVYESGNKHYLDVLLTATSMSDMLNKSEYVSYVSLYDYNILKKLEKAKKKVADIKQKLDMDLESNKLLQEQVNEQRKTMEALVDEKKVQIAQYDSSIAGQEQEVQKYMNAKAEAEAIIAAAEAAAAAAPAPAVPTAVLAYRPADQAPAVLSAVPAHRPAAPAPAVLTAVQAHRPAARPTLVLTAATSRTVGKFASKSTSKSAGNRLTNLKTSPTSLGCGRFFVPLQAD